MKDEACDVPINVFIGFLFHLQIKKECNIKYSKYKLRTQNK